MSPSDTPSAEHPDRDSWDDLSREGLARATALLHECATTDGFLATPTTKANYRRVWARDGIIMSLAALQTGDEHLTQAARKTLVTLAEHQGPHGEIPSNVERVSGRVSYGGTTGRVDADLWFVIGVGEYWQATHDDALLERLLPATERACFVLGAWEYNNRGLLYVPQTGDWADEYLQCGYVLYDQLLYLQAQRTLRLIHRHLHGSADHSLQERIDRLKRLIQANYWSREPRDTPDDVYHEVLYRKGRDTPRCRDARYWLPSFAPQGYGYRFDAFANVLASLLDVSSDEQRGIVDEYIWELLESREITLLPAFYPVIRPVDDDWEDLQTTFSYTFKNNPHEYHNGGLWPMITGFYAADLAERGKHDEARACLRGVHEANALIMDGEAWSFPEYVHGKEYTPGGTRCQGWSAAAAVIADFALRGRSVFLTAKHED
jgi:glycogen debranching enzyme